MSQMKRLVNVTAQAQIYYKNMLSERDRRIAGLHEEAQALRDALAEVESRAEAEMRRRTWSELSHNRDRDSVKLIKTATSQERDSVDCMATPAANERRHCRNSGPHLPQSEKNRSDRVSCFGGRSSCKEVRKGRHLPQNQCTWNNFSEKTWSKDMHWLASASRCSTQEEERMVGEDKGLHFV